MINELFTKDQKPGTKYIALPNAEEPRVMLSLANKKVFKKGFEIHNTASPLNRLFKNLSTNFSFLLPYIHPKILYPTQKLYELLEAIKQNINQNEISSISVYVGTKNSANQKLTMQLLDDNNVVIGIAKIAYSVPVKKYLMNEVNICKKLSSLSFQKIITPGIKTCFEYKDLLVIVETDIFENGLQSGYNLNDELIDSFAELKLKTENLSSIDLYISRIKACADSLTLPDSIITEILRSQENISKIKFPLVLQHGDFVPYNMKVINKKYALIDWEFAVENGQPFYDLFHYVYQGKYRILKESHEDLILEIMGKSQSHSLLGKYFGIVGVESGYIRDFFILYLVEALGFEKQIRLDFVLEESHFYKGLVYLIKI